MIHIGAAWRQHLDLYAMGQLLRTHRIRRPALNGWKWIFRREMREAHIIELIFLFFWLVEMFGLNLQLLASSPSSQWRLAKVKNAFIFRLKPCNRTDLNTSNQRSVPWIILIDHGQVIVEEALHDLMQKQN